MIEVGCLAHARRRFFEIVKTQKVPGLAAEAIAWFAKLYEIESRIKEELPDQKLLIRQAESAPQQPAIRCDRLANATAAVRR